MVNWIISLVYFYPPENTSQNRKVIAMSRFVDQCKNRLKVCEWISENPPLMHGIVFTEIDGFINKLTNHH